MVRPGQEPPAVSDEITRITRDRKLCVICERSQTLKGTP